MKLDKVVKKIRKAVEDPKPYREVRRVARLAQLEALRTTQETIPLAEQRLLEDDKRQLDSASQEMLSQPRRGSRRRS